jgi:hypothetical protein
MLAFLPSEKDWAYGIVEERSNCAFLLPNNFGVTGKRNDCAANQPGESLHEQIIFVLDLIQDGSIPIGQMQSIFRPASRRKMLERAVGG